MEPVLPFHALLWVAKYVPTAQLANNAFQDILQKVLLVANFRATDALFQTANNAFPLKAAGNAQLVMIQCQSLSGQSLITCAIK
jgi:hypothetical protein